ncbi:hypothetical protein EVAR_101926_1 [Eumeta japonica]|uniref:Uncharacterized protein n=1 Tax=Eumeta variegata TaxID=151549 RepID=A0A4C1TSB5_EUMVA|nr:hypothetical protein EVAR_101926_1 [Eumeta japonica]
MTSSQDRFQLSIIRQRLNPGAVVTSMTLPASSLARIPNPDRAPSFNLFTGLDSVIAKHNVHHNPFTGSLPGTYSEKSLRSAFGYFRRPPSVFGDTRVRLPTGD